jgi:hypothetical protein
MGVVNTSYTFLATDTITSEKMNNIIDDTTFMDTAVLGTTLEVVSGQLKVRSGGVTSNELASNSVRTSNITDLNVTTGKIADSSVTAIKLATDAVETAKIKDANVTAAKLDGAQTGSAPIYGIRAWVCFDPDKNLTGGVDSNNTARQLVGSGNVASVTKLGTGRYRVNLTTAMPDDDYSIIINPGGSAVNEGVRFGSEYTGRTSSEFFIVFARATDGSSSGDLSDPTFLTSVMVVR